MPIEQLYKLFKKCTGVSTDTRTIKSGDLFIALKGDNFNGNQYAEQGIEKGAQFAVIDEEKYHTNLEKYILVPNALEALQNLSNHHRKQFDIPVIGLTGSNGKTTTKELITAVLSQQYKVIATKGNLNNHIGVPLTLLNINEHTEIAVIEMGANHIGEIKELCEIAEPNFGLITTIGKAHLEGFGSLEGVRKTKMELFDFLQANKGFAFINADQQKILDAATNFDFDKKITYGQSPFVDVLGIPVKDDLKARLSYQDTEIESQLFGHFNFINLLTAIAVGNHFSISLENMKKALKEYAPQNKRSQIVKTANNTLIIDAYNANPTSMEIAISEFANQHFEGKKMLIIGDMLELGAYEKTEHQSIIQLVKEQGFNAIYFVGEIFYELIEPDLKDSFFKHTKDLIEHLQKTPQNGYNILIKGSRKIKLEELLDCL